jgi:NAD(P)-dependent dehydrogenase (short-subunit alcohol dehydrogenase family)
MNGSSIVGQGRDRDWRKPRHRPRDQLDELAASLPLKCLVQAVDLREAGAAEAVVEAAVSHFGRLDLVVNNAGATKRGDFLTLPDVDWDDGFRFQGRLRSFASERGIDLASAEVEMAQSLGIARFGVPDEIARVVAFLASPQAEFCHGAIVDVDGGQTRTL